MNCEKYKNLVGICCLIIQKCKNLYILMGMKFKKLLYNGDEIMDAIMSLGQKWDKTKYFGTSIRYEWSVPNS